ncbi:MAG: YidC/Oxa1 family membrane protein insertase [Spirochaetaceae bacterium]|nr:YidC/Oxa1 family membrane protein insertase [Spirochaetaceae bacterium]
MISDIGYFVFIYPLETIIEFSYLFVWRIFHDTAIAVVGVSAVVSTLTLPLYFMAERQQRLERAMQKRLKPAVDNIRAVFRGDERYMMLAAWYRQNNYHPVYSLRSSLGLIIQIPFFIAAYHFLSGLEALNGTAFLFIKDLGKSDGALNICGFAVNILPVLMTAINCASSVLYTRGFALKEKIQLYGMAALFLILLYNSPAGLVLYWTCNNLYSLIKNFAERNKSVKRIGFYALGGAACMLAFYVLFIHDGVFIKRLVIACAALAVPALFLLRRIAAAFWRAVKPAMQDTAYCTRLFVLSLLALMLLAGFFVPSTLIASSAEEFSNIKPFNSPLPFIGITMLQASGVFLWAFGFFIMARSSMRVLIAAFTAILLAVAVLNTFVFGGNYGFMLPDLVFAQFTSAPRHEKLINIAAIIAVCAFVLFLLRIKRRHAAFAIPSIMIGVFIALGIFNIVKINRSFMNRAGSGAVNEITPENLNSVYTFSKTSRNVLVIMCDRGISGYVPFIFREKPELLESWSGFTYYPNCVSFGPVTTLGAPPVFGGYEYTPLEIQKRSDELLEKKFHEALYMLPTLMSNGGFNVTVSNLPWMNGELYDIGDDIKVADNEHDYLSYYLSEHKEFEYISYYKKLSYCLVRYSLLKFMPLTLHKFFYDHGDYFSTASFKEKDAAYSRLMLDDYSFLSFLSRITRVTNDDESFANIIVNNLTHEPAYFDVPSYEPASEISNRGNGPFAQETHYHVNMATFILLGKFFDFLKKNGVYDNTRIIIVSDHGWGGSSPFPDNIKLPNGGIVESYNPLFLVKDFNNSAPLQVNMDFMTNADTPDIAARGLIVEARNPFTGKTITADKEQGATITTAALWHISRDLRGKRVFNIKKDQWMHVHDNIFKPENWSQVETGNN